MAENKNQNPMGRFAQGEYKCSVCSRKYQLEGEYWKRTDNTTPFKEREDGHKCWQYLKRIQQFTDSPKGNPKLTSVKMEDCLNKTSQEINEERMKKQIKAAMENPPFLPIGKIMEDLVNKQEPIEEVVEPPKKSFANLLLPHTTGAPYPNEVLLAGMGADPQQIIAEEEGLGPYDPADYISDEERQESDKYSALNHLEDEMSGVWECKETREIYINFGGDWFHMDNLFFPISKPKTELSQTGKLTYGDGLYICKDCHSRFKKVSNEWFPRNPEAEIACPENACLDGRKKCRVSFFCFGLKNLTEKEQEKVKQEIFGAIEKAQEELPEVVKKKYEVHTYKP